MAATARSAKTRKDAEGLAQGSRVCCADRGHRRLTVQEMNYATRRRAELQTHLP
jgi:hypothetical protein